MSQPTARDLRLRIETEHDQPVAELRELLAGRTTTQQQDPS